MAAVRITTLIMMTRITIKTDHSGSDNDDSNSNNDLNNADDRSYSKNTD